jgi:hypothetical protein
MPAKIELAIKPVRVSIPASVAANIDTYKKAIGSVLDRLGCPQCCSGHDIFFELQRDIVLAEGVKDLARVGATPKVEVTALAAQNTLRVGIKPELGDSIDNVFTVLDRIAEISGHPACATGCDMFLQLETNFVLDARLDLTEQAISVGNRAGI